jgi:hypothetical protein
VITEEGCKDLVFDTLEVYPQTDIKIETNLDEQCLRGNEFNFTNNSSIKEGGLITVGTLEKVRPQMKRALQRWFMPKQAKKTFNYFPPLIKAVKTH